MHKDPFPKGIWQRRLASKSTKNRAACYLAQLLQYTIFCRRCSTVSFTLAHIWNHTQDQVVPLFLTRCHFNQRVEVSSRLSFFFNQLLEMSIYADRLLISTCCSVSWKRITPLISVDWKFFEEIQAHKHKWTWCNCSAKFANGAKRPDFRLVTSNVGFLENDNSHRSRARPMTWPPVQVTTSPWHSREVN